MFVKLVKILLINIFFVSFFIKFFGFSDPLAYALIIFCTTYFSSYILNFIIAAFNRFKFFISCLISKLLLRYSKYLVKILKINLNILFSKIMIIKKLNYCLLKSINLCSLEKIKKNLLIQYYILNIKTLFPSSNIFFNLIYIKKNNINYNFFLYAFKYKLLKFNLLPLLLEDQRMLKKHLCFIMVAIFCNQGLRVNKKKKHFKFLPQKPADLDSAVANYCL